MQQNRALAATDAANAAARPESAATSLEKKIDVRMNKMSKDITSKLDGMMKMINKIAESNHVRKNTEMEEYYMLDANGEAHRMSSDSIGAGELSARSRAQTGETVSSTKASRGMSFRPSIDGAISEEGTSPAPDALESDSSTHVIPKPEKVKQSKSMSSITTPVGIMRKMSADGGTSGSKKRHSFSDPIATVNVIQSPPPKRDSFNRGSGANAEGVVDQLSVLFSDDGEGESIHSVDGGSPTSEQVPPLDLSSHRDSSRGSDKNHASANGDDKFAQLETSARSVASDSSPINDTPQRSPKSSRDNSPFNEMNQPQREVYRQKPKPSVIDPSPRPARKSVFVAVDSPGELARMMSGNQNQAEKKQRARSAGSEKRHKPSLPMNFRSRKKDRSPSADL